ncbi:MAG: UDP-glucose 4-epimerase [Candidatus Hinthialibacteria bacterium OLB16]|nr:MAG: UDP-glucose 4-epimerase [Candidatus Hinthialibacteria bacterium OLB16]
MNLLVVGGAGYIGSVTCQVLLQAGHKVVVVDNLSKGHRAAVSSQAVFFESDLGDGERIIEICRSESIDTALHFAAFTEVGESVAAPDKYFDNNTIRTKSLLDALLRADVKRFIFSSTAAVYGEPLAVPITEDHPKSPTNPYGWSKLFVEEILRSYHQAYGLRSVCLRYFNAAGAAYGLGEDHHPESHLIPMILQVAQGKRESIKIFGTDWDTPDGTCIRDFIHVADLASAHLKAVELLSEDSPGGAFNLGNGEGHSVLQAIQIARKVTGKTIPAVAAPKRPGDPARLVASSVLARQVLGWTPAIPDLESIIASAWEWRLSHPQGYLES